jgi:hypothetical protein
MLQGDPRGRPVTSIIALIHLQSPCQLSTVKLFHSQSTYNINCHAAIYPHHPISKKMAVLKKTQPTQVVSFGLKLLKFKKRQGERLLITE